MRVLIGANREPEARLSVRWLFEPRDLWVGIFWNRVTTHGVRFLLVYVSVVPAFPVVFARRLEGEADER